ncbi:Proton pump-interactor 1 [Forsythia ovata]|uniref:Proton pump-interactor 1 n=1 Tax=Forsythia ovata TaxID=205694 RepID=A0ABD1S6N5_9LAMI
MGVEVPESNLAVSVETATEENISVENENMNIKFGSHGMDEPAKEDEKKVSEANLPNNAADEWPEPSQIHSFYIVKYRSFEDQNLRAKLDLAEKELQKKNQARFQITEKLRDKRAVRSQVISEIRSLSVENKQFRTMMDEKRKEMEPLQHALGKLRGAPNGGRERGSVICSSVEELNDLIKSLQHRIQHESIPLSEEKQILREIKQLEGTREKVIANAAERAKIQNALGEKEVIQDQVKLIGVDLDGVRKEKQVVNAKLKQLDEEKMSIEKDINALQEELTAITEKRDKTFETIQEMRKQREQANAQYYQNRTLLIKAKELAAKKDVEALKELSHTEVEKFISLCSSNKAFRDDYERRILPSLDMRQLSSDGRLRNLDEKPLVAVEAPTPSETERIVKSNVKQPAKEDSVPPPQHDTSSEREKREKKKAGVVVSQDSEEPTEAVAEVAEPENTEEKVETLVPPKNKGWKENTTRHRARPRGADSLPKVILKRKKATNYWLWAIPAVFVVLVLLGFSYSYLSQDSRVE